MKLCILAIIVAASLSPIPGQAQWVKIDSTRRIRPQLSVGSLSVSASPPSVSMTLIPGSQSTASPTITITNLLSLTALGTFSLYASFSSSSALTTTSGDSIPSSAVFGKCSSSAGWGSFTQSGPLAANSSLLLYTTNSLATLLLNQTQTCNLRIDLTSLPNLPAGIYSGSLIIQAQAF